MEATRQARRERPDHRSVRGVDALCALVLLYGATSLVAAVGAVIHQLLQPGGQVAVGLTGAVEDALAGVSGLPPGTSLEVVPGSSLLLNVASLPWWLRLLTEAPAAVTGLCGALGALLVWRLLRDARAGRTFEARNPDRLVALAAVVLLASFGSQILDGIARTAVLAHLGEPRPGSPITFGFQLDLTAVLLSFVLVALAEAFRHGRRLTQDVDGLV